VSTLDVTVSPLGNGFYGYVGGSMTNTVGQTHPTVNDIWGSGNYIVAPDIDFAPTPEYDNGPAPAFVPAIPIPQVLCVVGCVPPPKESIVPEPRYEWGAALLVICFLARGRKR
jgi:hypothetical protein